MWDYRSEKWWSLLSAASVLALQCAYNTAAITEYIGLALEFMGRRIITSAEEKKRVYDNLMKLFSVSMAFDIEIYFFQKLMIKIFEYPVAKSNPENRAYLGSCLYCTELLI